jgi:hypothetical protein
MVLSEDWEEAGATSVHADAIDAAFRNVNLFPAFDGGFSMEIILDDASAVCIDFDLDGQPIGALWSVGQTGNWQSWEAELEEEDGGT